MREAANASNSGSRFIESLRKDCSRWIVSWRKRSDFTMEPPLNILINKTKNESGKFLPNITGLRGVIGFRGLGIYRRLPS